MPNSLDSTGLTLATATELQNNMTTALQTIYGADIVLTSDSPDGQWMNIIIQAILDVQDLIMNVYTGFDPDNAIGVTLDQRVAINGIQRQAGTFTITQITVVTSASVNLYGMDQTAQQIYTVSDNAGNLFELVTTVLGLGSGTHSLTFQAVTPGAVVTTPNTITTQIVIVLGVTSVNNPSTYTTLGVNEESDAALKIRRQQSVSLASQGYFASLFAALENTPGVTSTFIYENFTNSTATNGVPGHYIWVILGGSGDPLAIATAIYEKRNAGVGMYGTQSYNITQVDGSIFTVNWDDVTTQNIFVVFSVSPLNVTTASNVQAIRTGLPISVVPGVFQDININEIATAVQVIDPNSLVTGAYLSNGYLQSIAFSAVAASGTFQLNYNGALSAAINWNDAASAVQTKLRAVSGLSGILVTGSISSRLLSLDLTSVTGGVVALVYNNQATNSLLTAGSAAVVITASITTQTNYSLLPASQINKFVLTSANIIITTGANSSAATFIQLYPLGPLTVAINSSTQFACYGGYGPYIFTLLQNHTSGTINGATGLYTAGATPGVDIVTATDSYGTVAQFNVTITAS